MAATVVEVKSYQIRHFSTRKYSEGPTIILYNAAGRLAGNVNFFDDSAVLPPATMAPGVGGLIRLYFGRSAFPELVEMLRTEKPVSIVYQPEGANNSTLETGIEPVGEGIG